MTAECTRFAELLSSFAAADLDEADREAVAAHVAACPDCAAAVRRYEALASLATAEAAAPPPPLPSSLARTIRSRAPHTAPTAPVVEHDVMTLDEVAVYLRVPLQALEPELPTMPVFELGGRLLCRRVALLEWIEERERRARRQLLLRVVTTPSSHTP